MSSSGAAPCLGGIIGTTISTPDLAASCRAYTDHLGFEIIDEGQVAAADAVRWQAPAMAGAPYRCLGPGGRPDFQFRFVEHPQARGYRAFSSHGWNAAELLVQDVDGMASALAGSPFRTVGAPADLVFCNDIRAMQIVGPAGELLYLTQFKKPVPGLDVPPARCAVDRVFIVILGGVSLAGMQAFYHQEFNVPEAAPMESRVVAMADLFGLDREHRFRIAALPLAGQSLIEIDEMPAGALPVQQQNGRLPPGIAMVSCHGPGGHRVLRGAAGELLEICTTPG